VAAVVVAVAAVRLVRLRCPGLDPRSAQVRAAIARPHDRAECHRAAASLVAAGAARDRVESAAAPEISAQLLAAATDPVTSPADRAESAIGPARARGLEPATDPA
jgi:hypothetical protein